MQLRCGLIVTRLSMLWGSHVRRLLPLVLVPVFLVSACGGGGEAESKTSDRDDKALADAVTVSGKDEPKLKVDKKYKAKKPATALVDEGDGADTTKGASVLVDYVAVNAKDGKTFDSTYKTGQQQTFLLDEKQFHPDLVKGLVDRKVGDRVAMGMKASDLIQDENQLKQSGMAAEDTLVFLFDIAKVSDPKPLKAIEGETDKLPADLPQLKLDDKGTPTGFSKSAKTAAAPKKLVTEVLVEGDGDAVEPGDLVTFQYLGQIYPAGEIFDQSYTRPTPAVFQIGTGGLIKAWDAGLVGMKKGSRVVLGVPPEQGYGKQGSPPAIPANAT
ncbi:MAG: hypothetical protein GEU96_05275, partial [Propionibacteriales bacterium]|nr:hypothetical protein [Propionibacteriales bacterium]